MKRLGAKATRSKSQSGVVKVITVRVSSGTKTITGKGKIRTG